MSEIGIPAQEIRSDNLQDRGTGRLFLPVSCLECLAESQLSTGKDG